MIDEKNAYPASVVGITVPNDICSTCELAKRNASVARVTSAPEGFASLSALSLCSGTPIEAANARRIASAYAEKASANVNAHDDSRTRK
jgi:hypothetical protein